LFIYQGVNSGIGWSNLSGVKWSWTPAFPDTYKIHHPNGKENGLNYGSLWWLNLYGNPTFICTGVVAFAVTFVAGRAISTLYLLSIHASAIKTWSRLNNCDCE